MGGEWGEGLKVFKGANLKTKSIAFLWGYKYILEVIDELNPNSPPASAVSGLFINFFRSSLCTLNQSLILLFQVCSPSSDPHDDGQWSQGLVSAVRHSQLMYILTHKLAFKANI